MPRHFEAIDSFRGIFAICIILFHMHYIDAISEYTFFQNSSIFVDFFFILSGFVMAHTYAFRKEVSFKKYLVSRTFRIFPLHIVMLTVMILLELAKLVASGYGLDFNNQPFTDTKAPLEIVYNFFLLQCWLPAANTLSWNYPSWAISIEYYSYMIFFATLLFRKKNKLILWGGLTLLLFIASRLYNSHLLGGTAIFVMYFFGGALTYLAFRATESRINIPEKIFTLIEFSLLAGVTLLLSGDYQFSRVLIPLLFLLQVYFFAFEKGFISKVLKHNIFVYSGTISYSLYLIHPSILYCVASLMLVIQKITDYKLISVVSGTTFINTGNFYLNNLLILITLTITFYLSGLSYKYIELKGKEAGRRLIS